MQRQQQQQQAWQHILWMTNELKTVCAIKNTALRGPRLQMLQEGMGIALEPI